MSYTWKGILAGLLATAVISAIIVKLETFGIFPQLNVISLIDRLGSIGRASAWVDHFIVGALLWGPIYAGFDASTDQARPRWQKGLIFGVITWVAMMVFFMPTIGAGLFGWRIGISEPIGMLIMNLIFGLVMGLAFAFLDRRFPTKAPEKSESPLATGH